MRILNRCYINKVYLEDERLTGKFWQLPQHFFYVVVLLLLFFGCFYSPTPWFENDALINYFSVSFPDLE